MGEACVELCMAETSTDFWVADPNDENSFKDLGTTSCTAVEYFGDQCTLYKDPCSNNGDEDPNTDVLRFDDWRRWYMVKAKQWKNGLGDLEDPSKAYSSTNGYKNDREFLLFQMYTDALHRIQPFAAYKKPDGDEFVRPRRECWVNTMEVGNKKLFTDNEDQTCSHPKMTTEECDVPENKLQCDKFEGLVERDTSTTDDLFMVNEVKWKYWRLNNRHCTLLQACLRTTMLGGNPRMELSERSRSTTTVSQRTALISNTAP